MSSVCWPSSPSLFCSVIESFRPIFPQREHRLRPLPLGCGGASDIRFAAPSNKWHHSRCVSHRVSQSTFSQQRVAAWGLPTLGSLDYDRAISRCRREHGALLPNNDRSQLVVCGTCAWPGNIHPPIRYCVRDVCPGSCVGWGTSWRGGSWRSILRLCHAHRLAAIRQSLYDCRIPWLLVCFELAQRRRRMLWLGLGGIVLGLIFLANFVQWAIYDLALVGGYAVLLAFHQLRARDWWRSLRPLIDLSLIGAIGVGIGAIQLLPFYELTSYSPRVGTKGYDYIHSWSSPTQQMLTLAAPISLVRRRSGGRSGATARLRMVDYTRRARFSLACFRSSSH